MWENALTIFGWSIAGGIIGWIGREIRQSVLDRRKEKAVKE